MSTQYAIALKVISRLLDYPTEDLLFASEELRQLVREDQRIPSAARQLVLEFMDTCFAKDLLDWQSDYDGLFERGRAVSLHLFEHIHGESRDRGQAMVDLLKHYEAAGLELGVRELPDYLPLYLEFAATQGDANAIGWLQDVSHILALLAARLEDRDTPYVLLIKALLEMAQVQVDLAPIREQVSQEERDDTPEALDKIWEEEMVTFGADNLSNDCSGGLRKPTPAQQKSDVMPVQIMQPAGGL